jgi:hypothetical protein
VAGLTLAVLSADVGCSKTEPFVAGPLRTPQELVGEGFGHSRVVMINDIHDGAKRLVRARRAIESVLPTAAQTGVAFLAMEALTPSFADEANRTRAVPEAPSPDSYLAQPEMRDLLAAALRAGMTLVAYEVDNDRELPDALRGVAPSDPAYVDWRERTQAEHLRAFLAPMPPDTKLLVVPGDSHLGKQPTGTYTPMAVYFQRATGIEPFSIDQGYGSDLTPSTSKQTLTPEVRQALDGLPDHRGGYFREQDPDPNRRGRRDVDAFIIAADNNTLE